MADDGDELCIGCLQVSCQAASKQQNLQHIDRLLQTEVPKAMYPHIVLLPELFAGYELNDQKAWQTAEVLVEEHSVVLQDMKRWASTYRCFLGGTVLELNPASGEFYNTFLMYDPSGKLLPVLARKSIPASMESFVYFSASLKDHVFQLDLAPFFPEFKGLLLRMGVMICYENLLTGSAQWLQRQAPAVDIILSPFSAPDGVASRSFPARSVQQYHASAVAALPALAKATGAWLFSANKAGPYVSEGTLMLGRLQLPFFPMSCPGFLPLTMGCDPSGAVLKSMAKDAEGMLSNSIPLAKLAAHQKKPLPKLALPNDTFICPMPSEVVAGFPLMEVLGWLHYRFIYASRRRTFVRERLATLPASALLLAPAAPAAGGETSKPRAAALARRFALWNCAVAAVGGLALVGWRLHSRGISVRGLLGELRSVAGHAAKLHL
jgi:predicted amidohydrolase